MLFAKHTLATVVLSISFLGCKPIGHVRGPDDFLPFIAMALEAGATASGIGKVEAKRSGSFTGCVTTGVVSSALNTASEAVVEASKKNPTIPSVDVDVSDCLSLSPYEPSGKEIPEEVGDLVGLWAGAALNTSRFYAERLRSSNCEAYETVLSILTYVEGSVDPAANEISQPDGKLSIPAVKIDFSQCKS